MYSEGQMQGIFILTAIPSFSMTTVKVGMNLVIRL